MFNIDQFYMSAMIGSGLVALAIALVSIFVGRDQSPKKQR